MGCPEHSGRGRTNENRVRKFPENFSCYFCLAQTVVSSLPGHSYVSRANPRDNTRHVVLTTASMRPMDFAAQLNVSLANGWGIVRTVADLCLKMPEGKYVLVKDPNKVRSQPSVPPHLLFGLFRGAGAHRRDTCETSGLTPMEHPLTVPMLGPFRRSRWSLFCSRSSDCMPCHSRHLPEKKKRKKARPPRKKWSPDLTRVQDRCSVHSLIIPYDCMGTAANVFHAVTVIQQLHVVNNRRLFAELQSLGSQGVVLYCMHNDKRAQDALRSVSTAPSMLALFWSSRIMISRT